MVEKLHRAPRNRTLSLSGAECAALQSRFFYPKKSGSPSELTDKIICSDLLDAVELLPDKFVDLMIIDPPYNLSKDFHGTKFAQRSNSDYFDYLESWLPKLLRLLKDNASVYLCGDWLSSGCEYQILNKYLKVRNRITWQREKGRGAKSNWKNCSEDIWFATVSDDYYFNPDAVKQKRRVLAPYKENGHPKDWEETANGKFRLTSPSNFWDDITIPYWSMRENTDHPTQKPEKLIAKLILASSKPQGMVFDPFGGSGTTAVTAKKLDRHFCSVDLNPEYCAWTLARLDCANTDKKIQGYYNGVFYERNTRPEI